MTCGMLMVLGCLFVVLCTFVSSHCYGLLLRMRFACAVSNLFDLNS
jgi:hypothetical protein